MPKVLLHTLILLATSVSFSQQLSKKLTNQDVIEMVSAGVSDHLVIEKIRASEGANFDTSVAGLRALKAARVSDSVVEAMINPHPVASAVQGATVASSAASVQGLPDEIGVYVLQKGKIVEVQPEIVGWQTGGVIKRTATLGIDKGHVNGKIMHSGSPLRVTSPIMFLIKTPEGTSATEYQLLRLYSKGNRREFRAITGGVFHSSGGAERTTLDFAPEKIGPRTWRVRVSLPKGEYGFLPPGISAASIASSGKMYTFGVTEEDQQQASYPQALPAKEAMPTGTPTAGYQGPGASLGATSDQGLVTPRDGITLREIAADGPAAMAGMRRGDVLMAIDGHYLTTVKQLIALLRTYSPGSRVAIRYRRGVSLIDTEITLTAGQ